MKNTFLILNFILLTLTFDSCYEDEIETPSCVSVDKSSKNDYSIASKIYEVKEIEFELLNDCNSDYTIIDYDVSGDIKNIKIEGLSKNKIIKSKKLAFKVIISPISIGNKTIGFFINTDIGQIYVSAGVNIEY